MRWGTVLRDIYGFSVTCKDFFHVTESVLRLEKSSVIKLHSHRDARRVRKRPGCYDQALSSAIFSLAINRPGLLGIVADKSAVSGKTLTTNKKKEDSKTKLLMFKRDKLFLLISLPTVAPSLNYHFKRGVEKAILQLTGLTGAGGTEELSSDKTCVSIGFENESLESRRSFQLTYPRYTRVQCTFSGCFFLFFFLSLLDTCKNSAQLEPLWAAAPHGKRWTRTASATHVIIATVSGKRCGLLTASLAGAFTNVSTPEEPWQTTCSF